MSFGEMMNNCRDEDVSLLLLLLCEAAPAEDAEGLLSLLLLLLLLLLPLPLLIDDGPSIAATNCSITERSLSTSMPCDDCKLKLARG